MSGKRNQSRRIVVPKDPAQFKLRARRAGRVSNWNYSGATLFYGLVGGPGLLALSAFLIRSGPMTNREGRPDWVGPYFFATILSGLAFFLLYRAFTKAVLWIDVGDNLRVRKLMHSVTRRWDDVEEVDHETDLGRMPLVNTPIPGIGIDVKSPEHRILVVTFRDQSSVRVEVTATHAEIIQELIFRYLEARHYQGHGKADAHH